MVDIAKEAEKSLNFKLATEVYERIIKEKGPAKDIFVELGNCLAQSGRINEAFGAFLKAFRLGTLNPEHLNKLVLALVKLTRERMESVTAGRTKGLIFDNKLVLDTEPFFCGLCLSTTVEPTTILCGHTFCRKCLEKSDPTVCVACGQNPKVLDFKLNILLNEVVNKLYPKREELNRMKSEANKFCAEGDLSKALEIYSAILEEAPTDHAVWSNKSFANMRMGQYAEALEDANQAVKVRPQWAKGYFRKGMAEEALNKSQEAALSYMKCLALDGKAEQADSHLKKILYDLLKPSEVDVIENIKHLPSTSAEPMSHIMSSTNSDAEINSAIDKIKSLLDTQFHECDMDMVLPSESVQLDSNPSPITADMFECSLCYRLLYQPVTTPCGHVFCKHCLNRSLDHSVDCPQCRGPLAMYLANRHSNVTTSVQRLIQLWFPEQLADRERQHAEDISSFSTTGNTAEIPVFVCTSAFPTLPCPLHVYEPRYRLMMRQVMESGVRQFGMVACGDDNTFSDYGTMLEITDIKFFEDGRSVVDTMGKRRFRVLERGMRDGYHTAKVQFLDEIVAEGEQAAELAMLHDTVYTKVSDWLSSLPRRVLSRIAQQFGSLPEKEIDIQASRLGPKWTWWVVAILPVDPRVQLTFLSMNSLQDRLKAIDRVLTFVHRRQ